MPKLLIILLYIIGLLILVYRNYIYSDNYFLVLSRVFHALFFLFIIIEQNFADNYIIKFNKFKVISKMGKYTYGLYLLHPIAIQIGNIIIRFIYNEKKRLFSATFLRINFFMLSMLLSYLSYNYVETYFLKLKSKFS